MFRPRRSRGIFAPWSAPASLRRREGRVHIIRARAAGLKEATIPKIDRKGAANPYTSLNGNMFSYLHPSGSMALRLPAEEREKFLRKYKTSLFEAYGVVQKEYVTVPDSLLKHTNELQRYFELSYQYVQTLKPKPAKKK